MNFIMTAPRRAADDPHFRPAAVLWDFDGTMVDTEPIWIEVETEILADHGTPWTHEQGAALCGTAWQYASQVMIEAIGDPSIDPWEFYVRRSTMVAERIRDGRMPWRAGAQELLEDLFERGVPCAVVSASPQHVLAAGLSRIEPGRVQVVVNGDDVTVGKPDPEGYLLAASRLSVSAPHCVVLEDSPSGCAAGRNSGAVVLAVPCMTPLEETAGQVIRASLAGVDTDTRGQLWAAHRISR